jgi:pimeloyl-ACP methyl ester carboxylesterase
MGAEEALRAATAGVPLRAVVADGAGASTTGDASIASGGAVDTSVSWMTMRAVEILSGDREPAPLRDALPRIRVPVLLIASNAHGEIQTDRAYAAAIAPRATLWEVPDAGHTKALATHPRTYAARVTAFLRSALR